MIERLIDGASYVARDGRIVRIVGSVAARPELCHAGSGEWYVRATGVTYGVVGDDPGALIALASIDASESPPGDVRIYNSLAEAKDARLSALATRRWRAEQDFSFGGNVLALDASTQSRIGGAIQWMELANVASVDWQVAPGAFSPLTLVQIKLLAIAAGAHVQACFANVKALTAQIQASLTIEAVATIDIEEGWP